MIINCIVGFLLGFSITSYIVCIIKIRRLDKKIDNTLKQIQRQNKIIINSVYGKI